MKETMFKVLMYNGFYIDHTLLPNGLYSAIIPRLMHKDTTIDLMVKEAELMRKSFGDAYIEGYCENLCRCKLVDVSIVGKF